MTSTITTRTRRPDRDTTARRLLASSAKHSYDPQVDIDWDAPLEPDLYGMSPEWSSLYGTALWDGMSEPARIRMTEHEFCSISGVGIWFEMILMQMILRDIYDQDPATPHVQFALTEIADECRHSIMFARTAEKFGAPSYRPSPSAHRWGRLFKTLANGPDLYAAILVAEEVLDIFQRELIADERVQPLTRAVSRIHVVEEARHMRFARDEIARRAAADEQATAQRAAFRRSAWSPTSSSTTWSTPACMPPSASTRTSPCEPLARTSTTETSCAPARRTSRRSCRRPAWSAGPRLACGARRDSCRDGPAHCLDGSSCSAHELPSGSLK